jgi:hypothetical protein
MSERLSNLGYMAVIKEATKGTPLTPTTFIHLYDENMNTNGNFLDQKPVSGNKAATQAVLQGQRSHKGDVTVQCEPNTIGYLLDMLLTRSGTTGSNPYTHTFVLSATQNPNSYTIDISTGNIVSRYWGVEASKLSPNWNGVELQAKISLSALGSFQGREIATVATTTLTLKTDYDPVPNKGLVVGDLVRVYKSSTGATLDTTIATVNVDGVTITLGASAAAFAAGDMIYLRPATATYTEQPTFLWPKTKFRPGATAAAALSATPLAVEKGSAFNIMHSFESDDGAMRSGSFDPFALVRTTGDIDLSIKRFFDTPEDIQNFNSLAKTAWVIQHLSGSTNQYEFRVTVNHVKTDGVIVGNLKSGEVEYSEIKLDPQYDPTDAAMFSVTLINAISVY